MTRARKPKKPKRDPVLEAVHRQAAAPGCADPNAFARWDLIEAAAEEQPAIALRGRAGKVKRVKRPEGEGAL